MSHEKATDSTDQIIASSEPLRATGKPAGKRAPRTKQLVRDAEKLIGRTPARSAPSPKRMLLALFIAAAAVIGAVIYVVTHRV